MPKSNKQKSSSSSSAAAAAAGLVYAVACGPRPGIYFQWENGGAQDAIRGLPHARFQSFTSIYQAQRYLEQEQYLVPLQGSSSHGWISSKSRDPILYKDPRIIWSESTNSSIIPAIISMDSSNTNDDQRKRSNPTNATTGTASSTATNKRPRPSSDALMSPSSSSNNPKKTKIQLQLDPIQQRAVDAAMDSQNVFLTGVAGTGKSLVTKLIYEQALERYGATSSHTSNSSNNNNYYHKHHHQHHHHHHPYDRNGGSLSKTKKKSRGASNGTVALCAPTGMAAIGLGFNGQTIHSLAGVKVPLRASDFTSMHNKTNTHKWQTLQCLIIDEVGMLSADFLDWLDVNVRQIRNRPLEPFGGIQLIFVGDFAQLGPVPGSLSLQQQSSSSRSKNITTTTTTTSSSSSSSSTSRTTIPPFAPDQTGADCFLNIQETTAFAFQTALWREANFCHVHLTQVYRQSDREFVQALTDLREQKPETRLVQNLINKCSVTLEDLQGRRQVFQDDAMEIPDGLLPTVLYTNNRNADRENAERLASLQTEHKRFVATDTVHMDHDVPSHAQSYVHDNLQKNKFFEQCQATRQLDLKIGAQVMLVQNISTEEELINGSRGVIQRFVLVPVVRDFKGNEERLIGPDDTDKYPAGRTFEQLKFGMTLEFEGKTWKIFKFAKYPLVRFLNHRSKIILPTTFERTMFKQGTCSRLQLPLRLSWAITIHKSQGCTLDWVICDLAGCFTAGQAYVALSRAKSMAGLQIRHFSSHAVLTNPLVDGFYKALANDTMTTFLHQQAGLWWYPLLEHEDWKNMFCHASGTTKARDNAMQFRLWVANYPPPSNYQGWKGYYEKRHKTIVQQQQQQQQQQQRQSQKEIICSPSPNSFATGDGITQRRTVTPAFFQQATLPCGK